MDVNEMLWITHKNRGKNFIRRVLAPGVHPVLPNENGSVSTHSMSYAEVDGRYIVYPTVIQPNGERELRRLEDDEAFDYAMRTGEYINFQDEAKAADYAKNYKKMWEPQ